MSGVEYGRLEQVQSRKTQSHDVRRQVSAPVHDAAGMAGYILDLQRTVGNLAVGQLLRHNVDDTHIGTVKTSDRPIAIQRIKIVVYVGKEKKEIETDEYAFVDLVALLYDRNNEQNKDLKQAVAAKAPVLDVADFANLLEKRLITGKFTGWLIKEFPAFAHRYEWFLAQMNLVLQNGGKPSDIVERLGGIATIELSRLETAFAFLGEHAKIFLKGGQEDKRKKAQEEERKKAEQSVLAVRGQLSLFCDRIDLLLDQLKGKKDLPGLQELKVVRGQIGTTIKSISIENVRLTILKDAGLCISKALHVLDHGLQDDSSLAHGSVLKEGFHHDYEYEMRLRRARIEKVLTASFPKIVSVFGMEGRNIVRLKYRGSLADGIKNAAKSMTMKSGGEKVARVMNLHAFDADAFIEISDDFWDKMKTWRLLPLPIIGEKVGLRALHAHLNWFEKYEPPVSADPKKTAEDQQRWRMALQLREAIREILIEEDVIREKLAEIEGYKLDEDEMGDFGFVMQPSQTSKEQVAYGKPYPVGELRRLGLSLLELLAAFEVQQTASGPMVVAKIPEQHVSIEHAKGQGRGRSYSI